MRRPLPTLIPALLILAFASGCDLFAPPSSDTGSIRVETAPAGATVSCNGGTERISPASFENLAPGLFMLTVRKDGFREARQTVSLTAGQKASIQMPLEPVLGLVLVQSTPAGAQVTVDGASRGATPLLIPDFPLGTRRVRASMPGFDDKEIEITVRDRTPIRASIDLASRTARLEITSEPSGASIFVDNAPRGATPCEIEVTTDAETQVELKLEGFAPFSEKVTLQAGRKYPIQARLVALPADLEVSSTPAGARVFVDGVFKGITPVTITGLARGEHTLRFDLKGYEPQDRTIAIRSAGRIREDAALSRNSGTLVLMTTPPEVEVFVDGEAAGTTTVSVAGGPVSEALRVDLLSRGEHTLQLTKRGYTFKPLKFTVDPGQVVQLQQTLTRQFIRDTAVVIRKDGGRYEMTGQFMGKQPNGDVELEVNPGIRQTIKAADIAEIRKLTNAVP